MRIIFYGTPDFAVSALEAIHNTNHEVIAAVTPPDKPAGRGKKMRETPVKIFAKEHNIPILQPTNLSSDEFLHEIEELNPDLQVVIAFRKLPERIWSYPKEGTFNIHASLLPQYRGAAPINHAIINGESVTGVTGFFLQKEIDTGNIIDFKTTPIFADDNAGTLHDKLKVLGAQLCIEIIDQIANGTVESIPQYRLISENTVLFPAPKIFKQNCLIHWDKEALTIHNLIRGLSPYPAAHTFFCNENNEEKSFKIFSSQFENTPHELLSGTIITDNHSFLKIACKDGFIHILELQQEGKKRMTTQTFFLGNRLFI